MVMSVGDLTDMCDPLEWAVLKTEMGRLTAAGIQYVFIEGNHDTNITVPSMASYDNFAETMLRPGGVAVPWVYDWYGSQDFAFNEAPVSKNGHWAATA